MKKLVKILNLSASIQEMHSALPQPNMTHYHFLFASTKIRDDTSMRCQSDARHYYKNLKLLFPFLHPISKQFTLASLCLIKNFLSTEIRYYKRGTLNSKNVKQLNPFKIRNTPFLDASFSTNSRVNKKLLKEYKPFNCSPYQNCF